MAGPGVKSVERDASQNLKTLGETAGCFVGTFNWGAVDEDIVISDTDELLAYCGKPDNINYIDWFSVDNFLLYTGNITIRRIISQSASNATSSGDGVLVKNSTDFDLKDITLTADTFLAKYPGDLGNSISVHVADSATYDGWLYEDEFDTAPSTSENAFDVFGVDCKDEMHVVIVDKLGKISGSPGSVLEKYAYLSKSRDGLDINNRNSYYKNRINRNSAYVWVGNPIDGVLVEDPTNKLSFGDEYNTTDSFVQLKAPLDINLSGGNTGGIADQSEYVNGYERISNIDDNEVAVVVTGNCGGDANFASVINAIGANLIKNNKRVCFFSPKYSDVVGVATEQQILNNILASYAEITAKHSYMSMATGWKTIYDKYNDVYRTIPTNSDEAGVFARIHNTIGKWASAAGYNKGVYSNALGLAYNPDETHRSKLYALGINSVIQEKGNGILLLGDKTLQGKNSSFSFLGTRFLFIELRNIISEASKYILFENNDDYTQAQFRDLVEPTLRDIKGKRGLHAFSVICDSSNNTNKVIQDGLFVGDIYIKANYSIQNVLLRFTSVNRTLSFEEVVQK